MIDRLTLLNWLLVERHGRRYLEIGCDGDATFRRVPAAEQVGVDPRRGGTHRMTSDEFFAGYGGPPFDLVFIDGLHQAGQVLRDVGHALRHLAADGVIVLHDCLPRTEAEQITQHPQTGAWLTAPPSGAPWTGDVWKAVVALRTRRTIDTAVLDADHGLGVVLPRPNTAPLPGGRPAERLTWELYAADRDELLRVMDGEGIRRFVGGPS